MRFDGGVLAVVLGRAGSRGLKAKNVRLVAGRPMICHTIDHARAAETVDRIVVSTDGDEIAAAAETMGAEVVRRPPELASDTAAVGSAARHAVEQIEADERIVVILYANVPVRPENLIDRAVRLLINSGADSIQSYHEVGTCHPCWMCSLDKEHKVKPYQPNTIHRRQDLPKLFVPDGGVIAVTADSLRRASEDDPHAFLGTDRRGIEVLRGSVVDVDTAVDLAMAQALLAHQISGGVG